MTPEPPSRKPRGARRRAAAAPAQRPAGSGPAPSAPPPEPSRGRFAPDEPPPDAAADPAEPPPDPARTPSAMPSRPPPPAPASPANPAADPAETAPTPRRAPAPAPTPAPPGLHVVSTPIGHARDVTLRALDLLAGVSTIAAEDTRSLRKLLTIHGIPLAGRPLVAYSDATAERSRPRLLKALAEGASVALVSEAGTPLVSDPGYKLVRAAREAGHPVFAAPGPSALLAALAVAGLPTDRFLFAGFPPPRAAARRAAFAELAVVPATLVLYESPRRAAATLADLAAVLGEAREAALCRELTKRFEEVRRAPLSTLATQAAAETPRGEVVILVGPPAEALPSAADRTAELPAALEAALARASLRDAVAEVQLATGLPRREVYAAALALSKGETKR